ncbi:hypothetical protein BH11PLA1_BH11PLA1_18870 [soil metagenome]
MMDAAPRNWITPRARGTAAVAMLCALVALQLVVAAAAIGGARSADVSGRGMAGMRAQYAADAGMAMALREVYVNADEDGDGAIGGVSGDGVASNDPTINGGRAAVTATTSGINTTLSVAGRGLEAQRFMNAVVVQTPVSTPGAPGVLVECWTLGSNPANLAAVPYGSTPTAIGSALDVNMPSAGSQKRWTGGPNNTYALRFTGKITIPTAGSWTLYTTSDDGSDLWIDGVRVVNNDGLHGSTQASGTVTLTAGQHDFLLRFFEATSSSEIVARWKGPGMPSAVIIPGSAFTFDPAPLAHAGVQGTISLSGDSSASATFVDGFNSANGFYGGSNISTSAAVMATNSTTASAWQMSSGSTLKGSAKVGVGGAPGSVISVVAPSTITGTRTAQTSRSALLQMTAPTVTATGAFANGGTFTQTTDKRYTSFQLWGASSTYTVTGDVSLVVNGDFSLSNSAQIIVTSGSCLRLYVAGNVNIWNQTGVNATGLPNGCLITLTGAASVFNLTDDAKCVAHVRGWNAAANIYTNADFYGTLRVNTLAQTAKARIHLDVNAGAAGSGSSVLRGIISCADVP